VIKAGDSLIRIAARYEITLADLLAANPQIDDPNGLHPGDIIYLPSARGEGHPKTKPRPIYFWEVEKNGGRVLKSDHMHRVNSGDTFYRIAARYAITYDDLVAANPQANPFWLYRGELLYIPIEKLPEGVFTFYETPPRPGE
jgi:LysM repeat protein